MMLDVLKEKRRLIFGLGTPLLVVAVALTVLLGRDGKEAAGSGLAEKRFSVEIERVISGHSAKTDEGVRVNYAGIRAPYSHEELYEEAQRRNAELVEGKKVRLRFDEQVHDRKDRLNAYMFVDGQMVNETLVREGLAYVRLTSETTRFAEQLLAAQHEAQKARKGLWRYRHKSDETTYPADPKYGTFHRPSCEQVASIKPERRTDFSRRRDAFDKGLAPCSKCQP